MYPRIVTAGNLTLANVGYPMLLCMGPPMVLALPIIVWIEVWTTKWTEPALRQHRLFMDWLVANLWSSLAGIPLTWLVLLLLQFASGAASFVPEDASAARLLLHIPWLLPGHPADDAFAVPAAAAILLIPFWAVSVLVEEFALRKRWIDLPHRRVRRVVCRANLASYGLILLFLAGNLTFRMYGR